MKSIAKLFFF